MAGRSFFVLSLLLAATPFFAATSSEIPVSKVFYEQAPADQVLPSLASDGNAFLAVWTDARTGEDRIFAARLDENGDPIDKLGIRVDAPVMSGIGPVVVWTGTSYLVLWNQQNNGYSIHGVRVSAEGVVLDAPRLILDNAVLPGPTAVASNGKQLLLSYGSPAQFEPKVLYVMLDSDGNVTSEPRELGIPSGVAMVASNGSDFLMVASITNTPLTRLYARRFDAAGAPLDDAHLIATGGFPRGGALASDGKDWLLVYRKSFDDETYTTLPIARDGRLGAEHDFRLGVYPLIPDETSLVWSVDQYVFAGFLSGIRGLNAVRFHHDGTPLDTVPMTVVNIETAGLVPTPALASSATRIAIVWADSRLTEGFFSRYDIFGAAVGPDLRRAQEKLVSLSATEQLSPRIATNGTDCIAVWTEADQVFLSSISVDGSRIGPAVPLGKGSMPSVVFDGTLFHVAYRGGAQPESMVMYLTLRTLTGGGSLLGAQRAIASAYYVSSVTLATNRQSVVAGWTEVTQFGASTARVGLLANGQLSGAPVTLNPPDMPRAQMQSIAWNGSIYLAIFNELLPYPCSFGPSPCILYRGNVRGARLTPSLTLLDPQPLAIALSDSYDHINPRIAASGSDFLVAWSLAPTSSTPNPAYRVDVEARYLANDGTVLDPAINIGEGSISDAIWDGSRYFLTFTRAGDVLALRLSRHDEPLRPERLTISATRDTDLPGNAAPLANGRVVTTYSHIDPTAGHVERAFLRVLDPAPVIGRAVGRR